MDYSKFIVSNQKEESISIQRVKVQDSGSIELSPMNIRLHNFLMVNGNGHAVFCAKIREVLHTMKDNFPG